MEVSYSEYRNGNEKVNTVRKVPNTHKHDDVTLKRGLVGSDDLFAWLKARARRRLPIRATVTITLLDEARNPRGDLRPDATRSRRSGRVRRWRRRAAARWRWKSCTSSTKASSTSRGRGRLLTDRRSARPVSTACRDEADPRAHGRADGRLRFRRRGAARAGAPAGVGRQLGPAAVRSRAQTVIAVVAVPVESLDEYKRPLRRLRGTRAPAVRGGVVLRERRAARLRRAHRARVPVAQRQSRRRNETRRGLPAVRSASSPRAVPDASGCKRATKGVGQPAARQPRLPDTSSPARGGELLPDPGALSHGLDLAPARCCASRSTAAPRCCVVSRRCARSGSPIAHSRRPGPPCTRR